MKKDGQDILIFKVENIEQKTAIQSLDFDYNQLGLIQLSLNVLREYIAQMVLEHRQEELNNHKNSLN